MSTDLRLRFDYGHVLPWVSQAGGRLFAVTGPDAVVIDTPISLDASCGTVTAEFDVAAGDRVPFVMTYRASHLAVADPRDADRALRDTQEFWLDWIAHTTYYGAWSPTVRRSLITLTALTYSPTGGIVAAPTTSATTPGGTPSPSSTARAASALLLIPQVGFLPWDDPRVVGTVRAIAEELDENGYIVRYRPDADGGVDGLGGKDAPFLACSFWMVTALAGIGEPRQAVELFERLLALCNDVGLLSEECEPSSGTLIGDTPQAFSHVGLVNAAVSLNGGHADRGQTPTEGRGAAVPRPHAVVT